LNKGEVQASGVLQHVQKHWHLAAAWWKPALSVCLSAQASLAESLLGNQRLLGARGCRNGLRCLRSGSRGASGSLSCFLPGWEVMAEVSNEWQEELSRF